MRNAGSILLVSMLALGALAGEEFADIQSKIESFTLDNGLTVILYPRHNAPVVSCVTYVKTGSVDEHVGITGIAHQLEHLAFKGTGLLGTKNFEAEKNAIDEIDKLYDRIQAFQKHLPPGVRDGFLSMLASVTTGLPKEGVGAKVDSLTGAWKKDGFELKDSAKEELAALIKIFAEKVQNAEQYVEQNQYSNVIDRNGGVGLNAFTSTDCTCYHISLPANKLELWAALESDRYMNTFPRQLEKEKQVVLEERRMRTDSSPFGKLYETLLGVAFQSHPYGTSVIGHRSDILNYSREKVMRFYRGHYAPGNSIVSLVGDFEPAAARKIVTDYFSRVPAGKLPDDVITAEPAQEGERRVDVEFPAQPMLAAAYHIPELNHADTPALKVLESISTSGRASRFYTGLVKAKKASSVNSWLGPGDRYPRLIFLTAETVEGGSLEDLENDLYACVEKLKTEPPTRDELERVVTRYRADKLRQLRNNLDLAIELASFQALTGDWRSLFREIQEVGAVTPVQVTAAAKKYLTRQNRTVGRVVNSSAASKSDAADSVLGVPLK